MFCLPDLHAELMCAMCKYPQTVSELDQNWIPYGFIAYDTCLFESTGYSRHAFITVIIISTAVCVSGILTDLD